MKQKITLSAVLIALTIATQSRAQSESTGTGNNRQITRCGQEQYENYLRTQDPQYDLKRAQYEADLQKIIAKTEQGGKNGLPKTYAQYTIPVVFHVVYNTSGQNVPDQQIQYALDQMNQDWSHTNSDTGNTPSVWKTTAANMQIQFCLATKDNNGNLTNGIVRKSTTVASFTTDDKVKKSSQGGDDPWNANKYLNIWICNLGGGLLGYGAFPPVNNTYGTVVHYKTVGSLAHPFSGGGVYAYGRTLSHEIGHCFNLYHIWGNGNSGCSNNSDNVSDTPSMDGPTSGCPSGVQTSPGCGAGSDGSPASNAAPGRMYQNIMDYTDDLCYNMFTNGQKTRCQSAIASSLTSIANSATNVCGTYTGIAENTLSGNLSIYPNPSTGEVNMAAESLSAGPVELNLYNLLGKSVLFRKIAAPAREIKVDLGGIPDGIYMLEIKSPESMITKKIILNR